MTCRILGYIALEKRSAYAHLVRSNDWVWRALADLQAKQAALAPKGPLQIPADEMPAIKRLVVATFGAGHTPRGGVIEVLATDPGVFRVGHFTEPRNPRDPADRCRSRRILFRAKTSAELEKQIRLWRSRI